MVNRLRYIAAKLPFWVCGESSDPIRAAHMRAAAGAGALTHV